MRYQQTTAWEITCEHCSQTFQCKFIAIVKQCPVCNCMTIVDATNSKLVVNTIDLYRGMK